MSKTKLMQATEKMYERQIAAWMRSRKSEHIDDCGDVNLTSLVEAWDSACSTGCATLDSEHPAWSIAVEVAS